MAKFVKDVKFVDVFHFRNHVGDWCAKNVNPHRYYARNHLDVSSTKRKPTLTTFEKLRFPEIDGANTRDDWYKITEENASFYGWFEQNAQRLQSSFAFVARLFGCTLSAYNFSVFGNNLAHSSTNVAFTEVLHFCNREFKENSSSLLNPLADNTGLIDFM
jgi:hypothetical protein